MQKWRPCVGTKAHLTFDDPQDFWENILWTDKTKVELLGRSESCYIQCKTNSILYTETQKMIPVSKTDHQLSLAVLLLPYPDNLLLKLS